MEFEDILHQVGGYGKYQRQVTIFFLVPNYFVLSWIMLDGLFVLSVPEHWCYVKEIANSNLSITNQREIISPPSDPSCSMYNINYTEYIYNKSVFPNDNDTIPCSLGWDFDSKDYDATAATKWNLVCDKSYLTSFVLTLQNIGSLVLTPIYGFLADKYGRKRMYFFLVALASVFGLASLFSPDFIMFSAMRTVYGSVMPTVYTLAFVLSLEIVDPDMRANTNGIVTCAWTMGLCFLPLLAYLTRNWFYLGLICFISLATNLLHFRFIQESPSWLLSKGKYDDAAKIMENIAKTNGKSQNHTDLLKKLQVLGESIKSKKDKDGSNLAFLLWKNLRTRKRFFILSFCWIAYFTTYYGPMFNLSNLSGNEFTNFFLLTVVEVPGNVLFWVLMDKLGRRWTSSVGFLFLGLICLGPLTGFEHSDVIFSMVGKLMSTGLFMVSQQQATEIFPTIVRSFAMTLGMTFANLVTLLLPFLSDLGEYQKELPFVVMGSVSFIAGCLSSFLPETLNQNLPQTFVDAENLGKEQKFFSWIRQGNSSLKCSQNATENTDTRVVESTKF